MPAEDPRTPEPSPAATADASPGKELRRDIRRVTSILGETLARTEGAELLALVEDVRAHAKEDRLDQLRADAVQLRADVDRLRTPRAPLPGPVGSPPAAP